MSDTAWDAEVAKLRAGPSVDVREVAEACYAAAFDAAEEVLDAAADAVDAHPAAQTALDAYIADLFGALHRDARSPGFVQTCLLDDDDAMDGLEDVGAPPVPPVVSDEDGLPLVRTRFEQILVEAVHGPCAYSSWKVVAAVTRVALEDAGVHCRCPR